MSTNTQNTQTTQPDPTTKCQPVPPMPNYQGFGLNQMTDFMTNNLIITKFSDIFKDDFKFTSSSIIKLFLLVAITELKGVPMLLITSVFYKMRQSKSNIVNKIFL